MLNKSNLLDTTIKCVKNNDENEYYSIAYEIGLNDSDNMIIKYYNEFSLKSEVVTFEKELESRNIIDEVENLLKDYVLEHFNRYDIQEMGSCIYNIADEKAYDLLCNYINELHENYYFDEEYEEYDVDNYAEKYYEDIDIYCIDEIIDDILNAPVTMEEKLADVGMSIKDFL